MKVVASFLLLQMMLINIIKHIILIVMILDCKSFYGGLHKVERVPTSVAAPLIFVSVAFKLLA